MPRLATLTLLLGLFGLVVAAPAWAQKDPRAEAKAQYQQGRTLFDQGEYEKAIDAFRAADQLAPSGVNDFNIALAYEQLGRPADAIRHYRSYLARVPDASNKAAVEASIARLEAQLEAEAKQPVEPPPDDPAEPPSADPRAGATGELPPPADGAPAPTGDPELDRAAAIDINAIRDRQAIAPIQPGTAGAPPPLPGAAPPVAPGPAEPPPKAKPVYKKWWFWVIVGVAAIVLINVAVDDSSDSQPTRVEGDVQGRLRDMPMPVAAPAGGATLLTF